MNGLSLSFKGPIRLAEYGGFEAVGNRMGLPGALASGTEVLTQEITRGMFLRGVSHLTQLGIVQATSKKTDHVERLIYQS